MIKRKFSSWLLPFALAVFIALSLSGCVLNKALESKPEATPIPTPEPVYAEDISFVSDNIDEIFSVCAKYLLKEIKDDVVIEDYDKELDELVDSFYDYIISAELYATESGEVIRPNTTMYPARNMLDVYFQFESGTISLFRMYDVQIKPDGGFGTNSLGVIYHQVTLDPSVKARASVGGIKADVRELVADSMQFKGSYTPVRKQGTQGEAGAIIGLSEDEYNRLLSLFSEIEELTTWAYSDFYLSEYKSFFDDYEIYNYDFATRSIPSRFDPLNKYSNINDLYCLTIVDGEKYDWLSRNVLCSEPDHSIATDYQYYYNGNYYFAELMGGRATWPSMDIVHFEQIDGNLYYAVCDAVYRELNQTNTWYCLLERKSLEETGGYDVGSKSVKWRNTVDGSEHESSEYWAYAKISKVPLFERDSFNIEGFSMEANMDFISNRRNLYSSSYVYEFDNIYQSVRVEDWEADMLARVIIEFNEAWADYFNTGNTAVFDYLDADCGFYKFAIKQKKEKPSLSQEFLLIDVQDVRRYTDTTTYDYDMDYYYVWVHEKIEEVYNGKTTMLEYHWIYEISSNGYMYFITDNISDPYYK